MAIHLAKWGELWWPIVGDFTGDKPARACYQAAALPLGVKVEIEAIAVK